MKSGQRIPTWAYLLFAILVLFFGWRFYLQKKNAATAHQPPVRPVLVTKVVSKDVPVYLDEIGTCAAYETVQVQAQVTESLEETVPSDILGKLPNLQYFASVSGGRLIKGRFPILKHD